MAIVLSILSVYLVVLIGVAYLSVHPLRVPLFLSPGLLGLPQANVEFNSKDGTLLRGWWVAGTNPDRLAVLAHGYLMNRAELLPLAVELHREGYSVLLFDFRAHGKSRGRKCGLGWTERLDVAAAVEFARHKLGGDPKVLLAGSSMGCAAIALAVADDPALGDWLVLDSAYSRLVTASSGWWRFLGGRFLQVAFAPVQWIGIPIIGFNPLKVDVGKALSKVAKPVLFLHGGADTLAPRSEAERNYAMAAGPKHLHIFEGYDHSAFRFEEPERYLRTVMAWVASVD